MSALNTGTRPLERPARRKLHPAQKVVLIASAGVLIGSFLPWVETGLGIYRGFAGPGLWTFYAGVLGFGGGLVPVLSLAKIQTAIMAAVAIALPVWQLARLLSRVGLAGWSPGIGLVMVLGSGLFAARALWSMHTTAVPAT